MDKQFEIMLRLFGAASTGKKTDIPDDINIDAVVSYAHKQGVWQLVYTLLQTMPEAKKYHIQFLMSVSEALKRNEFTLGVIEKLQESGIDICLLKGVFASSLYANSDCRISGDTDVLINKKDEKKVIEILKSAGYSIAERNKNDHHIKCKHPIGGLMEVHLSLYSEITDMIIFGGKLVYDEAYIEFEYGNRKIKTLGINDNLKYLTAHYIKHLITGGSSIRQMMDLLLYIQTYKDRINFDKYNELMKLLKYDKLVGAVKTIGAKYFGMDFAESDYDSAEALLADCEMAGLFGSNSMSKTDIYSQFCEERKEVSNFRLRLIFLFKNESSIFNRLFPNKEILIKRGYKYARHSILTPVAWIHNICGHSLRKKEFLENRIDEDVTQSRQNLMKKLGMLE